jgi:hypothetical protein
MDPTIRSQVLALVRAQIEKDYQTGVKSAADAACDAAVAVAEQAIEDAQTQIDLLAPGATSVFFIDIGTNSYSVSKVGGNWAVAAAT